MHFKILVTLAAIATTAYADPSVQAKPKTEPVCNPKGPYLLFKVTETTTHSDFLPLACQKAVNIQRDSCVDAFKKAHSIKGLPVLHSVSTHT